MDNRQRGSVSIFSVIFAALLLTVLTVGFIKLMVREQNQATNNDLSQSAYDAALAGVEDAKRVVRKAVETGDYTQLDKPDDCDVVHRSGFGGSVKNDDGAIIQTSRNNGSEFNQAYTCVNIHMKSDDFLAKMRQNETLVVPLRADRPFDTIVVEWFNGDDVGNRPVYLDRDADPKLLTLAEWGNKNRPSLMRAQFISLGETIQTENLDTADVSRTAFLHPSGIGQTDINFSEGVRPRATEPNQEYNSNRTDVVKCETNITSEHEYLCGVQLKLGRATSPAISKNAFLRLNSLYKDTHIRVTLKDSNGNVVKFDGGQPVVDSTGRTGNIFRRVEARLQVGSDFNYPANVVELNNSLCKDFSVTRDKAVAGECQP